MKANLRYLMLLAVCLIPFTLIGEGKLPERFPIAIGITLAVTIAYWSSYIFLKKKKEKQKNPDK